MNAAIHKKSVDQSHNFDSDCHKNLDFDLFNLLVLTFLFRLIQIEKQQGKKRREARVCFQKGVAWFWGSSDDDIIVSSDYITVSLIWHHKCMAKHLHILCLWYTWHNTTQTHARKQCNISDVIRLVTSLLLNCLLACVCVVLWSV